MAKYNILSWSVGVCVYVPAIQLGTKISNGYVSRRYLFCIILLRQSQVVWIYKGHHDPTKIKIVLYTIPFTVYLNAIKKEIMGIKNGEMSFFDRWKINSHENESWKIVTLYLFRRRMFFVQSLATAQCNFATNSYILVCVKR